MNLIGLVSGTLAFYLSKLDLSRSTFVLIDLALFIPKLD